MLFATLADLYSYFWLGWLLLFVIIEVSALWLGKRVKQGESFESGTLSFLVWRMGKNKVVYFIFLALFLILGVHFFIKP